MKSFIVGALAAALSVTANAQDAMSTLMGMAQAAANSPSAKTALAGVVPSGLTRGVVVEGGQVVAGAMPMAITCVFVEPNACRHPQGPVPFHKYIIQRTGETSFTIDRIDTKFSGSSEHATIYFTLNQ